MTNDDLTIVIERVFDAPRDLVFEAWTRSDHMEKWYGPKGFSARVEENDFRPGGKLRVIMIGPDGTEYPSVAVFREIVVPEMIVAADDFEGELAGSLGEMVQRIVFEDQGDKTRVTIRIEHDTLEHKKGHEEMGVVGGYNSMLDCLEEFLATMV
ncbi:MAG: SRPBCC domain-containing protein [Deltaproteobacteria bacterium]|nr:SRPBCC domain-containing protein [bacterium]MCB9487690.1 SRPBCC domain-containing protein [Deltaproteobacteria bacterium]